MPVKKGQIIEIDVEDMAFGGKGLARIDGMAVFVDQAAAGDRVEARIIRKRKQYAEARVLNLIAPSADRIAAPCPYSGYCGGCKWQFLRYAKQLEYKRRHVADALRHIGLLEEVNVHPTLPADPIFGYRNKMEFSCADRRWLLPAEMGRDDLDTSFALGLHVPGTFHKVLDTEACLLQPDLGNTLLGMVRREMRRSGRPAYGLRSHEGFWRFLMLRHSVAHDRWMVNLITAEEDDALLKPLAARIIEAHPQVAAVVNNVTTRKAAVAFGEYEVPLAGDTCLRDGIGPYEFQISANSFFQTNTRSARMLYETARAYARLTGSETVMDLYCGTGTIAIFMAEGAREVVGIEMTASAIQDARRNCRQNGVDNCRFFAGDVRRLLPTLTMMPEVMVIDPPRDGMHKDVVAQVKTRAPQRIVYVSCNPATLARDIGLLKANYHLAEVQPVDMFPHTWHIEAVARLEAR
ncbi:MAG: 23S rRNA (uracil(1939)-C(5))-methyltransferase RlmD [Desulfobacterales bacterium]|nr:23S rRNA (uracil(1939)-C(5))-methyltransferase RlmD [Desulfobacterales bacterium]